MPTNLNQVARRKLQRLKSTLDKFPRVVGQETVRFVTRNFDKGGFHDGALQRWKPRKNKKAKRNKGRALLVNTGQLRDSVRVIRADHRQVVVGTDVPYAKVHNEGGLQQVRAHNRTSKKGKRYKVKGYSYTATRRQFIGKSKTLTRHLKRQLVGMIKDAIR